MMKTNMVRQYIATAIREATGISVAFFDSNNDVKYPYITYEINELTADYTGRHTFDLVVDAWDRDSVKRIEDAIDKLDSSLIDKKDSTEGFVISIYAGDARQMIHDEDRRVRRIQRHYDVLIFEKEM